jgi:uncharacterized protein (DUF1778 family)
MVVLKRRYRLVTFRVHSEEYELLTKACLDSGARSISEFSRAAVLQKVQQTEQSRPGTLTGDLATLSDKLADLDAALEDARKKIRNVLGSSAAAGSA